MVLPICRKYSQCVLSSDDKAKIYVRQLRTFGKLCLCSSLALLLFQSFESCFYTRVRWWFLTEVWVTASLLKSPGPFSVFWLILIMLLSGWSPLVLFSSPFTKPLEVVPSATITIGETVTFVFQSFFQVSSRVHVFISHFAFF